jgi:hypothetical protein
VDPVPDLLLLRKSGSAGNRTRTSGSEGHGVIYYIQIMRICCTGNEGSSSETSVETYLFHGIIYKDRIIFTLTAVGILNFSYAKFSRTSVHSQYYVRFKDFPAVAIKNAVFWDTMPYGSCKNRRFGGT